MFDNKIISNKIRCIHCDTVIESKSVHDFRWCKCKNENQRVAVDGGKEYLKRCGNPADWEELSIVEASVDITEDNAHVNGTPVSPEDLVGASFKVEKL